MKRMDDHAVVLTDQEAGIIALDAIVVAIKQPELPMRGWGDYPMIAEASWWAVQAHIDRLGDQLEQRRQEEALRDGIDLVGLMEKVEG